MPRSIIKPGEASEIKTSIDEPDVRQGAVLTR